MVAQLPSAAWDLAPNLMHPFSERMNALTLELLEYVTRVLHINSWCGMKSSHNVIVKTICDADELLFPSRSKMVFDQTGIKPKEEWDMRKVFDDKEIDAVSIVIPNHWHALATIWACGPGSMFMLKNPLLIISGRGER